MGVSWLSLPGTWDSRFGQFEGSPTSGTISLLEEVSQVPQFGARLGARQTLILDIKQI